MKGNKSSEGSQSRRDIVFPPADGTHTHAKPKIINAIIVLIAVFEHICQCWFNTHLPFRYCLLKSIETSINIIVGHYCITYKIVSHEAGCLSVYFHSRVYGWEPNYLSALTSKCLRSKCKMLYRWPNLAKCNFANHIIFLLWLIVFCIRLF